MKTDITHRKWTSLEEDVLKHCILAKGITAGCKKASKLIRRTKAACEQHYFLCKKEWNLNVERRTVNSPKVQKILRKHIKANPNNIKKALKLAAEESGFSFSYLNQIYYETNSTNLCNRHNIGYCFLTIGSKGYTINGKNDRVYKPAVVVWERVKSIIWNILNK